MVNVHSNRFEHGEVRTVHDEGLTASIISDEIHPATSPVHEGIPLCVDVFDGILRTLCRDTGLLRIVERQLRDGSVEIVEIHGGKGEGGGLLGEDELGTYDRLRPQKVRVQAASLQRASPAKIRERDMVLRHFPVRLPAHMSSPRNAHILSERLLASRVSARSLDRLGPEHGRWTTAAAMHPFASYVLRSYYKQTGWNEDNLYANLTRSSNGTPTPLI